MNKSPNCEYDIAITGGGLAGLSYAILAADAGYKVILMEKERYPFHKVCGEYISMESWEFLKSLGVPLMEWELPMINKLNISDAKGKLYDFSLPLGGFGVSRYLLDDTLYHIAIAKGVIVKTECKVNTIEYHDDYFSIHANNEKYTARVSIGSFGKRSNLDVKWKRSFVMAKPNKLNNLIGVKYHIRYPQPADTISLHNFRNGYCGISQVENNICCLCYLTSADNLYQSDQSIQVMERKILSENKQLKKIFAESEVLYSHPLTISQISFEKKSQLQDHVLLLGDAAGMIPPLCGNGMSMALHAAKLAFEVSNLFMAGLISREEMEKRYLVHWKHTFGFRTRAGRFVQFFFGGDLTTAFFLRTMHRYPTLSSKLIAQTHGKVF